MPTFGNSFQLFGISTQRQWTLWKNFKTGSYTLHKRKFY